MFTNNNFHREGYISIKQPKLFRIGGQPQPTSVNENGQNNNYDFEKQNQELKKRIHNLNKMSRQNKKEEEDYELMRLQKCFYKNPFSYMDYLAKKYFTEKANILENMQIKKEIISNFQNLCFQIQNQIKDYTQTEELKLQYLQQIIENKLNGKNSTISKKPISLQKSTMSNEDQELLNKILVQNVNTITSSTINNNLNNNINNYQENLSINEYKEALSFLKGNQINKPKRNFLVVNDINSENEINNANYDKFKSNYIVNNLEKNDQKKLSELIAYSDNHINNMINLQKQKEGLINNMNKKFTDDFEQEKIKIAMEKLNLCEQNLNDIKNEIAVDVNDLDVDDLYKTRDILDSNFKNTNKMVDNFLKTRSNGGWYKRNIEAINDDQIDKLYDKYKKKVNIKNRNKSANYKNRSNGISNWRKK